MTCIFVAYSQSFTQNVIPTTQCTAWNTFIAQLDPSRSYNSLTFSGTASATTYQLKIGVHVTTLVQHWRAGGGSSQIYVDSFTWVANFCESGIEANPINPWTCGCSSFFGRNALYPCANTSNWGGLNSSHCFNSPSQSITLTIQ